MTTAVVAEIRCRWCGKKMGQVEVSGAAEVKVSLVCANRRCGQVIDVVID